MDIEAFFLCDAATDQRGKLNVLGAFDIIWAKETPVTHPACTIVARIRFYKTASHSVKVDITDKDGFVCGPKLVGDIKAKLSEGRDSAVVNLVLNIQRLKFEMFGKHTLTLQLDGKEVASRVVFIEKVKGS